jgi:hypothetical protein
MRERGTVMSALIIAVEKRQHFFGPPVLTVSIAGEVANDDAGDVFAAFTRYVGGLIGAAREREFRASVLLDKLNACDDECRPTLLAKTASMRVTLTGRSLNPYQPLRRSSDGGPHR